MTFTYPSLAALGVALAAVPIVIHLLNRRRRKRVAWAAMDFLLQSDRKNRTWVRLSEWLLLAARVIAIALVGCLAGVPKTAGLLDGFFGADQAVHLVLVDDTASMQRRGDGSTAWDEATAAIGRLIEAAVRSGDRVEVVRYTDRLAGRLSASDDLQGPAGLATWGPTAAVADPADGIRSLLDANETAPDSARIYAYLLSDFAETTHPESGEWMEALRELGEMSDEVIAATCGSPVVGNLTVSELSLAPGPVAAGVETRLTIEVVNHSDVTVPTTVVAIQRDGQPLTAIDVGPFEPRSRRRVETPIVLPGTGLHVINATLPADALPIDDTRWLGVETPATRRVVLVDNSERQIESRVYAAALRPLGRARSGWSPKRVERLTAGDLDDAAAVLVLDLDRMSRAEIAALRAYVAEGGGVFWTLGPRLDTDWYNRFVAGGLASTDALTPWRIGPPTSGPVVTPGEAMIAVSDHFVVRVLAGQQNGFVPLVRTAVRRRLASDDEVPTLRDVSATESTVGDTLIELGGGEPLLLANRYQSGSVISMLTTAAASEAPAPPWSNLASLPIFPVFANDLVGWLAKDRLVPDVESIGETAAAPAPCGGLFRWRAGAGLEPAEGYAPGARLLPPTPGVYRRGNREQPAFTAIIDPAESDLRAPDLDSLRARLGGLARVGRADELFRDTPTPAGRTPLYAVATALLTVCVLERGLAFRNSYVASATASKPRRETL